MMTKPRVSAPRARRDRVGAAAPGASQAPLIPSRIAFLGSAEVTTDAGQTLLVRCLCWPSVPAAWNLLTQAWTAVSTGREHMAEAASAKPSWICACAPQLGGLFGDSSAEESSVAALVLRAPMQIAVAIDDRRERRSALVVETDVRRHTLAGCLGHYDHFLRKPGREACTTLVARGQGPERDRGDLDDLAAIRARMPDARWLPHLQLRFWNDAIEPLPLEIAHVAAAAIARQRVSEEAPNPIFAAALSKLSHEITFWRPPSKPRRR